MKIVMHKRKLSCLAVLLTLVLLLTGCQSIMEGLVSGAAEALANKLDNMEPYPLYLDQRIQYGMSMEEVETVLGQPLSSTDMTNDEEFSMPVAMHTYDWTLEGKAATLKLMFIGDNLCEAELTIPCETQERAQLVEELKILVEDAYGELPGFSWQNMTSDMDKEIGYIARFSMTQGTSGFQGEILGIAGEISISCTAV